MADDYNRRACDKRFEHIEADISTLERDMKNNLKWRESIRKDIGALYGHIDNVRTDLLARQDETANRISKELTSVKTRVTLLMGGVVGIAGVFSIVTWLIDKLRP